MNLGPPSRRASPFRRAARRPDATDGEAGAAAAQTPVGDPEDDVRPGAEPAEPGWRGSSYDLKHGLDVVELPTTLPVDVLDRLFNSPGK